MARTVVITGCSDGGLGAALAIAFHKHGDRVIASARNPAKMASLKALGIETLALDILSEESIKKAVEEVSKLTNGALDILLNNAGTGYSTPLLDASLPDVRKLFELNTFAPLRVSQLFFPLLRNAKNGALLVNNTSVASVMGIPFQGPYSATKAAQASLSETLRLELEPFNIKVIDLKTGTVESNFFANATSSGSSDSGTFHLPDDSLYAPGREQVEKFMRSDVDIKRSRPEDWAEKVVRDLSQTNPPRHVWRGSQASLIWLATFVPASWLDGMVKKMSGLDIVNKYWKGGEAAGRK
jgi:1-acylglycerone phosphate reductase